MHRIKPKYIIMEAPMAVKGPSEYLKLDRMTICRMLKEGKIPASRKGLQRRFILEDIDTWIRSKRVSLGEDF